jgi:NAD(P)H-hydrate epimerase
VLSAEAAYRAGAGLVSVATPAPNVRLLSPRLLEATWLPLTHQRGAIDESAADILWEQFAEYTAALVGPGLGTASATAAFIDVLFSADDPAEPLPTTYPNPPPPRFDDLTGSHQHALPGIPDITLPPLVIDADGLNLLAELDRWWKRLPAHTILTPHPGEMARLAGIGSEANRSAAHLVQANRFHLALDSAKAWQCIVLLKGANTLIAAPDGRLSAIPVATPALARAGTGDVLAGMIVGLLAQRIAPFEAATLGAYLHAQAGLIAAERLGTVSSVLASDVIAAIPAAIGALEGHQL